MREEAEIISGPNRKMSMAAETKPEQNKELSEIRKEVIEARNLVIKTDSLLKNLHAEVKAIGKRHEDLQKRQWISSGVAYAIFAALCGFSTSYAMLFALRALFGLGMGGEWAAGMPLVLEHWPKRLRGFVSGLMLGGWYWGYLLAAAVFQFIYPLFSDTPDFAWRTMFWVAVIPALITLWIRTGVSLVGQGLNLVLGVLASIPIGRGLGPSGKGEFALYSWAVGLGVVFLARGWHSAVATVASTNDRRGLEALRHIVISSEVGWRKPARQFFIALGREAAAPLNEVLYVGDDLENDYWGARAAGLEAFVLDPEGRRPQEAGGVAALEGLLEPGGPLPARARP